MRITKICIFLALSMVIGLLGCAGPKKVAAPTQEQITKNLVPAKVEVKGQAFVVELNDLKVAETVDTASKEITETPKLTGNIKIINKSDDILDIQGITLEYLDQAGKPIAFKSGETTSKVSSYWQSIKPQTNFEGSIDATIPRAAIKENALGKVEMNVVYVPTPLKRETLNLPEKVE